jgi:hypothetical protein
MQGGPLEKRKKGSAKNISTVAPACVVTFKERE